MCILLSPNRPQESWQYFGHRFLWLHFQPFPLLASLYFKFDSVYAPKHAVEMLLEVVKTKNDGIKLSKSYRTLCTLDHKPRTLKPFNPSTLHWLRQVEEALDAHPRSSHQCAPTGSKTPKLDPTLNQNP